MLSTELFKLSLMFVECSTRDAIKSAALVAFSRRHSHYTNTRNFSRWTFSTAAQRLRPTRHGSVIRDRRRQLSLLCEPLVGSIADARAFGVVGIQSTAALPTLLDPVRDDRTAAGPQRARRRTTQSHLLSRYS